MEGVRMSKVLKIRAFWFLYYIYTITYSSITISSMANINLNYSIQIAAWIKEIISIQYRTLIFNNRNLACIAYSRKTACIAYCKK